mmetsp:Transcript_93769/g.265170  ORF Transcript_93769/g.265170 Transcript_93769/m.265170 type:complete len:375 (-) Transcript_93769:70-1194(-)
MSFRDVIACCGARSAEPPPVSTRDKVPGDGTATDAQLDAHRALLREVVCLAGERVPGGLTPWLCEWCTDATVERYFRGRKGNIEAAARILAEALCFRQQHQDVLSGAREPRWMCDLRVLSRGEDGHPVAYGCFRSQKCATSSILEDTIDHMTMTFEAATKAVRGEATNADLVIDCYGFSLTMNLHPTPMLSLARMANQTYRDILRTAYVVDPPTGLHILWRMLSPLLSERTRAKVCFMSLDEAVELLRQRHGARVADTVLCVAMAHRGRGSAPAPRFPSEVSTDEADEGEEWLERDQGREGPKEATPGAQGELPAGAAGPRWGWARWRRPGGPPVPEGEQPHRPCRADPFRTAAEGCGACEMKPSRRSGIACCG